MKKRGIMTKLGLLLLGLALVIGFVEILEKRFAEGGIYPYYASFRSDPLGTSALYESLERMEGISVSRNMTHLSRIQGLDADSALLLLGYPRDDLEDFRMSKESPVLAAVKEGARLVLTINPELVPAAYRPERSEEEDDWFERRRKQREERARREVERRKALAEGKTDEEVNPEEEEKERKAEDERLERAMSHSLGPLFRRRFSFEIEVPPSYERPDEGWETVADPQFIEESDIVELPPWRSQYRIESRDKQWRQILTVDGEAVVLERRYGKGSIVLATDTYFVSNEHLHLGAEPAFLLWLLGGKSKVVFDETLHGTVETGGAMKLIRRYRAHGIFYGLLVFFILWAWRSASPLVPGSDEQDRGLIDGSGTVMGEVSGSGLIRLLRRSVPPANLLSECLSVWRQSVGGEISETKLRGMTQIVERQKNDPKNLRPAEAYRHIAELLRKR